MLGFWWGMTKAKASTLQQRFGFLDDDLKLQTHDEIMLWVDANIKKIVTDIFPKNPNWEISDQVKDDIDKISKAVENALSQADINLHGNRYEALLQWKGLKELPPKPDLTIESIVWEKPIVSKDYIIGFVDMFCEFNSPVLSAYGMGVFSNTTDIPIFEICHEKKQLAFEIKTSIPSLGELIRQIRMYQNYSRAKFVVISPDDRHAEMLKKQGIIFYKYAP